MYVVIGGVGLVGGELARRLAENKHDVVIIDSDREICDRLYAETGVVAIHGGIAGVETLVAAGIDKADVFVAATGNDTDNLAGALLARSFGVNEIIVRMRNPAYESAYRLAGVTSITRVTDLLVNQMQVEIEKPRVRRLMSVAEGQAGIYSLVIPKNAKVAGKTVEGVTASADFPPQCVFIALYNRDTKLFAIPRGSQEINEMDEILLVSPVEEIKNVSDFLLR
jgi:trk system potassium uptake protein TrkA